MTSDSNAYRNPQLHRVPGGERSAAESGPPATPALADQAPGSVVFGAWRHPTEPEAIAHFVAGDTIAWRARFNAPPGAARITVLTIRLTANWEHVTNGHELWLTHPLSPGFTGWIGPGTYEGPGHYLLRVVAGPSVLAEGRFDVVSPAPGVSTAAH